MCGLARAAHLRSLWQVTLTSRRVAHYLAHPTGYARNSATRVPPPRRRLLIATSAMGTCALFLSAQARSSVKFDRETMVALEVAGAGRSRPGRCPLEGARAPSASTRYRTHAADDPRPARRPPAFWLRPNGRAPTSAPASSARSAWVDFFLGSLILPATCSPGGARPSTARCRTSRLRGAGGLLRLSKVRQRPRFLGLGPAVGAGLLHALRAIRSPEGFEEAKAAPDAAFYSPAPPPSPGLL